MVQVLTREPREPSSNDPIKRFFSLITPAGPAGLRLVELRGTFDSHQAKHALELVAEHHRTLEAFDNAHRLFVVK